MSEISKTSPVVLYHAGCADGFCAAWVLWQLYPDATFIPVHYGKEPPAEAFFKHRDLYIVDFSYPADTLLQMGAGRKSKLVVLDHHKTAQEALAGIEEKLREAGCENAHIVFDMDKSGGRLTWEYCHRLDASSVPYLVQYTEDRDLWKWKLIHSKEYNAALRSYPMEFKVWQELSTTPMSVLLNIGEALTRMEKTTIDHSVSKAHWVNIGGYDIKAVNTTTMISEIAGTLAKNMPFGATYFDTGLGERIWSLRSDKEGSNLDVSEIAKKYGGGGHRNAAGFQQPVEAIVRLDCPTEKGVGT